MIAPAAFPESTLTRSRRLARGDAHHETRSGGAAILHATFASIGQPGMERIKLWWINVCATEGSGLAVFSRHCDIQPIEQHNLWAAATLATARDVICFDAGTPDIGSLKFIASTKTRFPSLPIVLLISQQSADMMLWALRTRIFDVLIKPLEEREVLRCMQRLEPALCARRRQSARSNATGFEAIPTEARYHIRQPVRGKLEAVIDFIAKHYARQITELEVAKTCGMSPFGFSRAFHAAYGVTFRDYLSDYRLAQSKRLLGNAQVSVSDAAAMAGFNDPSYFARLFRKRTGISPSEYRASLLASGGQDCTDNSEAAG